MNDLTIALCQCPAVWENADENCRRLSVLLEHYFGTGCGSKPDIIAFPEFFTTGFTMSREVAEAGEGISAKWMKKMADEYSAAVIGSVPTICEGKVYNRCYFMAPGGEVWYYDKRHLFRMGEENDFYSAGEKKVIIPFKGWNIALNVCYDLRFPVWSRNVGLEYDLMVNVASWPQTRIGVVESLVKARAVENMAYFAFLNRVGEDPENIYNGCSRIVSPRGEDIALVQRVDGVDFLSASLQGDKMLSLREKFPAWMDADKFEL